MSRFAGDYPTDWPDIARSVKEEAGGKCVRCGHRHDPEAGYTLTVHHLTGRKDECQWWNLAALCQRCHLRIQGRVHMERIWMLDHSEWFRPYVAGYYANRHGLADAREYVEPRIEALIALGQGRITAAELL